MISALIALSSAALQGASPSDATTGVGAALIGFSGATFLPLFTGRGGGGITKRRSSTTGAAPEYDASTDELIYDVPPLEEYFLDEDDLRDREERLQEQIVRVKQQQTQYEDHFPKFAADTPSQKVKIRFKDDPDVLDDDTSSVSSDVPLQDYFPGPSEGEVDTSSSREQKEPLPSVLKSPSIEQKETVEIGEVEVEETDWSKRRLRPKRSSWKDRVYISAKSWRMALDYTPYQLAALTSSEQKFLRSHFGHYQLTLSELLLLLKPGVLPPRSSVIVKSGPAVRILCYFGLSRYSPFLLVRNNRN